MRLQPDIIRQILLYIESEDRFSTDTTEIITEEQTNIAQPILNYHIRLMKDSNLINRIDFIDWDRESAYVDRLTKTGHDFLDQIRDEATWLWVKNGAGELGSFSVETLKALAKKWLENRLNEMIGRGKE